MSEQAVYGAAEVKPRAKVRTHHLQKWKAEGHKWAMLTAYDYSTARIFDDAEIPVLLVGASAANVVYGYDTTVPVTIDELIPLVRGVVRGAPHALVVGNPSRMIGWVCACGKRLDPAFNCGCGRRYRRQENDAMGLVAL